MELILPAVLAFLITFLSVPLTIKFAKRYGLIDDPRLRPHPAHLHQKPIPRAGGLAIYLGIIVSAMIFLPYQKHLLGILIAITVLLVIGLIDDKKTYYNPYLRLGLLFLAAASAVASGIGINFITNPLGGFIRLDELVIPISLFGQHTIVVIADLFAFLWLVALTQVINWSKGVDGQMPSITSVALLVIGFLSLRLFNQGDPQQLQLAKLAFISAGSALAFLIFNWYPAKIFPGFSGSTILAFMIASISILSGAKVATALLVLAIPSIDFLYTILRRIAAGKSPVWGDRGHLHHKLLDLGLSASQIALFYLSISAILGLVALSVNTTSKFFGLVVVSVVFLGFILWFNSFGGLSKKLDPDNG